MSLNETEATFDPSDHDFYGCTECREVIADVRKRLGESFGDWSLYSLTERLSDIAANTDCSGGYADQHMVLHHAIAEIERLTNALREVTKEFTHWAQDGTPRSEGYAAGHLATWNTIENRVARVLGMDWVREVNER